MQTKKRKQEDDLPKKHEADSVSGKRRVLPVREWNFVGLKDWELAACCWWE
jgi:hypothetical protein